MTAHWNNSVTFNNWAEFDGKCDIAILGAPFDMGAGARGGQRDAPFAIRTASYWGDYVLYHVETGAVIGNTPVVVDAGNSKILEGDLPGTLNELEKKVSTILKKADSIIVLGGDHSVSMATLRATNNKWSPLTIMHFDAHADTWPIEKGKCANHGNWLRQVVDDVVYLEVVQLGLRGYGPEQKHFKWAETKRIRHVTAKHLINVGLEAWCLHFAKHTPGPIYLSIDLDVCDPAYAPAVSTPEPGGFTSRDLLDSVRAIVSHSDVVGMDIVELCPAYDATGVTALLANRLVTEFCAGKVLRGR